MQNDLISIEPQVIQFNRQNTQTIKITNNTNNQLNNFFFCLYNVQKFTFKPQTFSLMPKQHKLIEITLRIKSTKSIAKQFAYLKSTQVNKRLTLLINNFNSPQIIRNRGEYQEEMSDNMNTLSSRDYHQLHNRALNKIIGQQQRLQNDNTSNMNNNNNVREFNKTQNFSIGSSTGKKDYFNFTNPNNNNNQNSNTNYYQQNQRSLRKSNQQPTIQQQHYIRQLQNRTIEYEKQLEQLHDLGIKNNYQIEKYIHQNKYLNEQTNKLVKKLSQKQNRINQLQTLYEKIIEESTSFSQQVRELKQTLQRQKQLSRQSDKSSKQDLNKIYASYQSRIKQLQQVVQSSQRNTIDKFNKQFGKKVQQKDKQLMQIRKTLQHQQLLIKQHQINMMKSQSQNKLLKQKRQKLQSTNKQLVQLNNNLKEQIFVYKSRLDEPTQNNNKLQQYLEIALQSYKTQNQNLKLSKFELQKSLQGIINTNRQTQTQNSYMQSKIDSLNKQLYKLQQQVQKQELIKQQLKAEHHEKIKEITNKNIMLLQNLALQNSTKREQQAQRLTQQIQQKHNEITSIKSQHQQQKKLLEQQLQQTTSKLRQLQEQNNQLQQKVKKYKKQAKKQLKSINDNAFQQLRRIHQEKKALQKKVMKLQKIVFKIQAGSGDNNNTYLNSKNQLLAGTSDLNSRSQLNSKSQLNQQGDNQSDIIYNNKNYNNRQNQQQQQSNIRSRSQYQTGTNNNNINRRTGIFNQRQYLYDSRSASTKNANISPSLQTGHNQQQPNYELFQLRQFSAFVHNQQQRFQYMFNLQSQLVDPLDYHGKPLNNIKPLYKAIKFFKVIQNKLKVMTEKAEQSLILNKQNAFIKQKLIELQKSNPTQQQQYQHYSDKKKDMSHITVTNPMIRIQQQQGPSFFLNRTNLTNLNAFQMIQFLKGQMKKQYNKQMQNIKFIEEKHQILKKKIYREYRTRIIQLINQNSNGNKRDKPFNLMTISKLQNLIQRFVQGLSNLSHKQAVLNKEIKIKNSYKSQNSKLKQKLNQMQHLLTEKQHGYCNRDPVKVFNCSTLTANPHNTIIGGRQQQWMQSIKLSAQLLTQKAQSQRLKQQLDVVREDYNQLKQEINQLIVKNDNKDIEIIKLKKNQLQLQKDYEKELEKQNQILFQTKSKLNGGTTNKNKSLTTKTATKYEERIKDKDSQILQLKGQIQKKNLLLRSFKEKQKKWEQYINQTNRSEQKEKSLATSYRRIQENSTLIKQNNRDLRHQNNQLKDIIEKLEKQLQKKKLYIKNLKSQQDQTRITKPLRIQQTNQQIRQLQQQLKSTKEQLTKLKKLKQKQINRLENQLSMSRNQSLIHVRSLQSVSRGLIDAVRKIFNSLKIYAKKKGVVIGSKLIELNLPNENLLNVNAAEIYQQFQEVLELLDK